MTRQKRRVFVKGEFFATDGHIIFGNKEIAKIITFKDRMVYIGVTSRAKGNEKADESFIKSKELYDYFELSQNTVSSSSQRLEDAGLAFRGFKMKHNKKKDIEEKKWTNTWVIPERYELLKKGSSKLLIDYNVLRSGSLSPRAKMVYFYLCYKSTLEDVNGEIQEKARVSRDKMAHALGIKNDENLTAALKELVDKGLVLRVYTRKTTNYGTQVDTPIYTIMELPQWIKNGEHVEENVTTATTEDTKDEDNKSVEVKKDSEAANNGVREINMALINTTESINDNSENTSNNQNFSEDDYMSGFLGTFEPTPTIEERGGEDVDAFLKEMDNYDDVEDDYEDEYLEEEVVEEEPVHIPSPTAKTTPIFKQTADEIVKEANNKVLDYRRNKKPELTKEDVSFTGSEFDALIASLAR
jgi:hypothetical protein